MSNEKDFHPYRNLSFRLYKHSSRCGDKNYDLVVDQYDKGGIPCTYGINLTDKELDQLRIVVGNSATIIEDSEQWKMEQNKLIKDRFDKYMDEYTAMYKGKIDILSYLEKHIKEIKNNLKNNKTEAEYSGRNKMCHR